MIYLGVFLKRTIKMLPCLIKRILKAKRNEMLKTAVTECTQQTNRTSDKCIKIHLYTYYIYFKFSMCFAYFQCIKGDTF